MAARLQTRRTEFGVARQMFVAGLAADAELFAQVGHGESPAARETDESNEFFYIGNVFPGHSPLCVTYLPGQSVTYLPGS